MRKKFFLFLLAIFLLVPGMVLVGCGEKKGDQQEPPTGPHVQELFVQYNGTGYDVNTDSPYYYWTYYQDDIVLNQTDFYIEAMFDDGHREELTSGYTFKIYTNFGDEERQQEVAWGSTLGVGSYTLQCKYVDGGEVAIMFDINSKDIYPATIELASDSYQFTGAQICPEIVSVTLDGQELIPDVDIDVTYGENLYPNEGRVTITGIGPKYTGETFVTFSITAIEVDPGENFSIDDVEWDSQNHKTAIDNHIMSLASETGVENVESITYFVYDSDQMEYVETNEVTEIGTYEVEIELSSLPGYYFVTTLRKFFQVTRQDISGLEITDLSPVVYNGQEHHYTEFVSEIAAKEFAFDYALGDHSIQWEEYDRYDNTNASTGTKTGVFELWGTGNYMGVVLVPFTILPYNVNAQGHAAPINDVTSYGFEYDGTAKVPNDLNLVISIDERNISLSGNYDYSFTCSNNINAGDQAQINVTFQGNYAGTATYYFSIAKRNVNLTETTFWTGDGYNGESYSFTYNRTNHADDIEVNEDQTFFGNTASPRTFNQLFSVELTHYLGTYPEGEVVWNETDNFTNVHGQNAYKTKATITMIDPNHTFTINQWDKNEIEVAVLVTQATATFPETEFAGKEYDGQPYAPTYTLTADLGGETPYALVAGTDYTISYERGYNGTNYAAAIHVGQYVAHINFTNGNYALASGKYEMDFTITKKRVVLTDTIITWPTVHRMVWGNWPLLQNDGNITIAGVSADNIGNYEFGLAYNSGLAPTHIYLDATNFETGYYDVDNDNAWVTADYEITTFAEVINPFESFKLNGVTLGISDIDSLENVNILDKIEFTLKDGATLTHRWAFNNLDYWQEWKEYSSDDGATTIVAGTAVKTFKDGVTELPDGTIGEYEGDYWIFSNDGMNEGYRNRFSVTYNNLGGSQDIRIKKNIFKTCKFGDTIVKDDNQDVTNWSLFGQGYAESQEVYDGDVIAVEYADAYKDHYIAKIKVFKTSGSEVVNLAYKDEHGDVQHNTYTVDTTNVPVGNECRLTFQNTDSGEQFTFTLLVADQQP